MIPIRLIITISIIAIISILTVQGFHQYRLIRQEQTFTKALTIIQKDIEAMVATGQPRDITDINSPNGTKQVHGQINHGMIYLQIILHLLQTYPIIQLMTQDLQYPGEYMQMTHPII